jgi:uncharacterized protein YbjT (DUF2867 family)
MRAGTDRAPGDEEPDMRVVVFGAAGGVGSRVVRALLADGAQVLGVVRRTDAAEELVAQGAQALVLDVAVDPVEGVLEAGDAVVWALGARMATDGPEGSARIDRDGALRVLEAAEQAGVSRWVHVSSMLADRPELGPPMLVPFLQAKGVADARLASSDLDWTVVRPSGLGDGAGTGVISAAAQLGPADWGAPIPPQVMRDDVAEVVLACLREGLGSRRAFDVSGGTTPIAEALRDL